MQYPEREIRRGKNYSFSLILSVNCCCSEVCHFIKLCHSKCSKWILSARVAVDVDNLSERWYNRLRPSVTHRKQHFERSKLSRPLGDIVHCIHYKGGCYGNVWKFRTMRQQLLYLQTDPRLHRMLPLPWEICSANLNLNRLYVLSFLCN